MAVAAGVGECRLTGDEGTDFWTVHRDVLGFLIGC